MMGNFGVYLWLAAFFVILSLDAPTNAMTTKERIKLREEVRNMFYHVYDNYMENAYPMDELKPLSCTGRGSEGRGSLDDVLGGFSLTLIDTLDTLVVLEDFEEFEKAVRLVIRHVTFNRNVIVSVFETTIRVLGGLLSAHLLSVEHAAKFKKGYNGELLKMATELGNRMLPAFNTPTGIPYSRVNLMMGIPRGELPETCTAGAGTLLLEFGLLSRLTGDPRYMDAARGAVIELWRRRSTISLVGNVINVITGQWIRADSSIGAGIDSYYEYLLKGYILFGDQELYDIFMQAYNAVEKYEKKGPWYVSVHMGSGSVVREWIENLQMFWPGLQVSLGHVGQAIDNFYAYYQLWRLYGLPPEAYSIPSKGPVPGVSGYPLRPEMIESAYMLHAATGDHAYLEVGKQIMHNINNFTRVECGYAAVSDVLTKKLEDRIDSFFLSETCKYLYLLFNPENVSYYKDVIFTTEGHLIPLRYAYHNPQVPPTTHGKQLHAERASPTCKNPELPKHTPLFPSAPHSKGKGHAKTPSTRAPKPTHVEPVQQFPQVLGQQAEEAPRTVVEAEFNGVKVKFLAASANFGPVVKAPLEGNLLYGTPGDGCTPLMHPNPEYASRAPHKTIVLIDRGICMFGEKIRIAMYAGAHAVIVADNIDQPNVFLMTDGTQSGVLEEVKIPSVLVNKSMGELLKQALADNSEYIVTLREARDDEEFAEEAQFYARNVAGGVTLSLDLGAQGLTQAGFAEAVLQQLQQMNIQVDGKFQIQYFDANNQPAILTLNGNPQNSPLQQLAVGQVPPEWGYLQEEDEKSQFTEGEKEHTQTINSQDNPTVLDLHGQKTQQP